MAVGPEHDEFIRRAGGRGQPSTGGVPDGLLVGILAFLLGLTALVWTATGLGGLFARGSWPDDVTFVRTPMAMRHLMQDPHNVPAAWSDTPHRQLPGSGLFWGLFIGQLMVLFVLAVFVIGTVTRYRMVRARRRMAEAGAAGDAGKPGATARGRRAGATERSATGRPGAGGRTGPAEGPADAYGVEDVRGTDTRYDTAGGHDTVAPAGSAGGTAAGAPRMSKDGPVAAAGGAPGGQPGAAARAASTPAAGDAGPGGNANGPGTDGADARTAAPAGAQPGHLAAAPGAGAAATSGAAAGLTPVPGAAHGPGGPGAVPGTPGAAEGQRDTGDGRDARLDSLAATDHAGPDAKPPAASNPAASNPAAAGPTTGVPTEATGAASAAPAVAPVPPGAPAPPTAGQAAHGATAPVVGGTAAAGDGPAVAPPGAVGHLVADLAAGGPPVSRLQYGTERTEVASQAILEATGPVLVVTSDPDVWAGTKDARAKLGPTQVFDPAHLLDTPDRVRWNPASGCESRPVAAARAAALLAPVRPLHAMDRLMADAAETMLRCWLHAAAVDGRPFRQVHRWAQGTAAHEPVRILRTHPKAAGGSAGELEATLTAYPERRDMAQELTARALAALSSVHIRDACNPGRADAFVPESFVDEGGTLYLVGESIEDPRTHPGAMPLLTALASSVVERGRSMAERSSAGRLDPPLTLVLDDVAAVAPFPAVPDLLARGAQQGLPTLALLRSREQARARWPHRDFAD